jgi:hypothetical protein
MLLSATSLAAALALLLAFTGCFTADAKLEADGSGTIDLEYLPAQHATIESETARFSSPHVTVRELVPRAVGAFLRATFDDVTKLSSAEGFSLVTVTRDRKHGEERLRIALRNPTPKEVTEEKHAGPHISVTLPGRVLAANHDAEMSGPRVSWRIPLRQYAARPLIVLSVRYAIG